MAVGTPVILNPDDIGRAVESTRPDGAVERTSVALPAEAVRVVAGVLEQLSAGHVVTLIPGNAELTVGQAAELLLVSPPFVLKLIDEGQLRCGSDRPVRLLRYDDVLDYKRRADAESRQAFDQMVGEAESLGLYE